MDEMRHMKQCGKCTKWFSGYRAEGVCPECLEQAEQYRVANSLPTTAMMDPRFWVSAAAYAAAYKASPGEVIPMSDPDRWKFV